MKPTRDIYTYLQLTLVGLIIVPAILSVSFILWGAVILAFHRMLGSACG